VLLVAVGPIGPNAHCPGEAADWAPTAHDICRDWIGPATERCIRSCDTDGGVLGPDFPGSP